MTLKAAVVGCGMLANGTHLPTIQQSDFIELSVACDLDLKSAEKAAQQWGAKRFSDDWKEVVHADDVDFIVLCTHTNLRGELIEAALKVGKPVYTEKPLAESLAEMLSIWKVHKETKVPVCVGHNRRSAPSLKVFKSLFEQAYREGASTDASIDRQEEGQTRLIEEKQIQLLLRVNDDLRSWKSWIFEDAQGIFLAEMVHFVDLALSLIPHDPVEVYAMGSPRGNFTQLIRFRDGSIATLQHTMIGHFNYPKELYEISTRNVTIGFQNFVEIHQRGLSDKPSIQYFPLLVGEDLTETPGIHGYFEATDKLTEAKAQGKKLDTEYVNVNKGHKQHLEDFARHIEGNGDNPCPLESAITVTRITLKLLESVRLGLPVKLSPEDYQLL